jgi:hypothetical protein
MRKLLVIIAAASVVLALAGVPAVSAGTSSARLTFTRIVIFNGLSSKPVGPKGPLTRNWTVYPKPADITTTNFGTLVEDTSLSYVGVTHGGTWWYSTSGVILHAFYWEHDGKKVKATSLAVPPDDNAFWTSLGQGVITPNCLEWVAGNAVHLITLNTSTWKWVKAAPSTCAPAGHDSR